MRSISVCFTLGVLMTFAPAAFAAAPIVSTFDTNLDGWTATGSGSVGFQSFFGNPAGSAEYDRFTNTPDLYAVAPAKFTGNLSAYDNETFSFDSRTTKTETGPVAAFGQIDLYYGGLATPISQDIAPTVPGTTWQTYSGPFTAAGFGVSQAQWTTALASVDKLTIFYSPYSVTQASSPTLLDNVILTPEPGSLSVLALGMIGLLRRKRAA